MKTELKLIRWRKWTIVALVCPVYLFLAALATACKVLSWLFECAEDLLINESERIFFVSVQWAMKKKQ